jgi:hypothetical protein
VDELSRPLLPPPLAVNLEDAFLPRITRIARMGIASSVSSVKPVVSFQAAGSANDKKMDARNIPPNSFPIFMLSMFLSFVRASLQAAVWCWCIKFKTR